MVLTPQNIAAALTARPELNRFGTSRLAQDQGSFKTMLTSQLGVSHQVLGSKSKDPLSVVTGMPSRGPDGSLNVNIPAQVFSEAKGPVYSETKGKAVSNEVRGVVNPNARHPEDLGHLPGSGAKAVMGEAFTKDEENLLQAAAAAESKFLAAKRRAGQTGNDAQYASTDKMGVLSAAYESRGAIDAIGYDGRGGTSYGLYQIASGVGTMGRFMDYLETKAPDIAARLSSSGPANTGGRSGAMAGEWKRIAQEFPRRFEALQHEFIRDTHYQPALKSITMSTGDDMSKRSQAVREVLWSTAVQHGPNGAAEIFSQAVEKLQAKGQDKSDKALIEEVYAERMTQFAGRGKLRVAVSTRLADEKQTALAMLGGKSVG